MAAGVSGSQHLSIEVVRGGAEAAIVPAGELDTASAGRLDEAAHALRADGVGRIVVDLRQVTFLDSSGLRVLLTLRNTAKRDGFELKLVPGPPQAQRIFQLTATRSLFDWRDY